MKLYQQLEQTLSVRINSNDDIIPALKKLMEAGRLDKPKEIAMFAIILDRLGKIENEAILTQSLEEIKDSFVGLNDKPTTPVPEEVPSEPPTVSEFTPENIVDTPKDTNTPE